MAHHPEYAARITSEHADKPKFREMVDAVANALATGGDTAKEIQQAFDLDVAEGAQLDVIGRWVGINRRVKTPITGVYFAWNDSANPHSTGWGYGVWKGKYDPSQGIEELPDDVYRSLIRARITANQWDGSIESAYAIWQSAFSQTGASLIIQDYQDMTMTVGVSNAVFSGLSKALLTQGFLPIKPAGVQIDDYRFVINAAPIFAWGDYLTYAAQTDEAVFNNGDQWVLSDGNALYFNDKPLITAGWGDGQWPELYAGA